MIHTWRNPPKAEPLDLSDGVVQHKKFEIGAYGEVNIVDGELEDTDKTIQNFAEQAGMYNIVKMIMAKEHKTLEQVMAEGQQRLASQPFLDVSGLGGLTGSDVEEKIQTSIAQTEAVAKRLGITPEEFVKLTPEALEVLIKKVAAEEIAAKSATAEKGNE